MAILFFGYAIDGEMLEIRIIDQGLAETCLAYPRCPCDNDIRLAARDHLVGFDCFLNALVEFSICCTELEAPKC